MTNDIAIIPARGGSKRIPSKNIVDFNGKPLIAWTIEAALATGLYAKVLVSTDSKEIAEISTHFGAKVPFLRASNYDDIAPISEATCDALVQAETYWNTKFDTVTQLMANCPLRTAEDIMGFTSEFKNKDTNFLLSCFKFGWMNPWWAFKFKEDGRHSFLFADTLKKRSQDLDDLFCPTGSIWIGKADALKISRSFYGEGQKFAEISWYSAVDIDDESDLQFARMISASRVGHS
jgi:CMP-N-acetylneuraminic acid synthetase